MKTILFFLAILLLLIFGISCSNDDPYSNPIPSPTLVNTPAVITPTVTPTVTFPEPALTDIIITFKADLKPDGVTDITYLTPIGNVTLILNQTTKTFKLIDAGADNFNPTYVNIHTADGTIVFVFPNTIFSPSSPTISKINDDQIVELTANHYYVNFTGSDGNINGQLIKQ